VSAALPAWLQSQLQDLLQQRGHALLLAGPPGLGQYDLALALARAWLCEQPSTQGACGVCGACHAVDVRTHPDLCVLMPETLSLELNWPLDEKTQDKIDRKELKPSKFIRVDATRQAVAFGQFTRSRGNTKVMLIHPADRLNTEAANTLLKTLEEPAGALRFVLTSESVHTLLPTIRSRCQTHALRWPSTEQALQALDAWCQADDGSASKVSRADLLVCLRASGGRPQEALAWLQLGLPARVWSQLPAAIAQGDFGLMADWPVVRQKDVLHKLCHDLMVTATGGQPRFFDATDLPPAPALEALVQWDEDLRAAGRSMEHPFNAGLQQEAWALRARQALRLH